MKRSFTCLIIVCILATACTRNKSDNVTPVTKPATSPQTTTPAVTSTGAVSGKLAPAGAITTVLATSQADGKTYTAKVDLVSSEFKLENLPGGKYTVAFSANSFFADPAKTEVTVEVGKNTNAGTSTASKRGFSVSCDVNGDYQGWNWKGYYSETSNLLQITNYSLGGVPESHDRETKYRLSIGIANMTGPGIYECGAVTGNRIDYNGISNGLTVSMQSTNTQGNMGTITITEVDKVAHKIKGTFTAKLAALGSLSNAREITNGIINTTY